MSLMESQGSAGEEDAHSVESLKEWLSNSLKLPQYVDNFTSNGVNCLYDCCALDEHALEHLGITRIGHKKRVIGALELLRKKLNYSVNEPNVDGTIPGKHDSCNSSDKLSDIEVPPCIDGSLCDLPNLPPPLPPKEIKNRKENGNQTVSKRKSPPPPPRRTLPDLSGTVAVQSVDQNSESKDNKASSIKDEVFVPTEISSTSPVQTVNKKPKPPKPPRYSVFLPPVPPREDLVEGENNNLNQDAVQSDTSNMPTNVSNEISETQTSVLSPHLVPRLPPPLVPVMTPPPVAALPPTLVPVTAPPLVSALPPPLVPVTAPPPDSVLPPPLVPEITPPPDSVLPPPLVPEMTPPPVSLMMISSRDYGQNCVDQPCTNENDNVYINVIDSVPRTRTKPVLEPFPVKKPIPKPRRGQTVKQPTRPQEASGRERTQSEPSVQSVQVEQDNLREQQVHPSIPNRGSSPAVLNGSISPGTLKQGLPAVNIPRTGSVSQTRDSLEKRLKLHAPDNTPRKVPHSSVGTEVEMEGDYVLSPVLTFKVSPPPFPITPHPTSQPCAAQAYEDIFPVSSGASEAKDDVYEEVEQMVKQPFFPTPDDGMTSGEDLESDEDDSSAVTSSNKQYSVKERQGYLYKQGGKENNKGWKQRWVEFDGKELKYFKNKKKLESLYIVPLSKILQLSLDTSKTKNCLLVETKIRTFMFHADHDELTLWLMTIQFQLDKMREMELSVEDRIPGGEMNSPDKQGFLIRKMQQTIEREKKYLVVIKGDKMCFYYCKEDFDNAMPAHRIEMQLCNVKRDIKSKFIVNTPQRAYIFIAESEAEMESWISAIVLGIQIGLSDHTIVDELYKNPSNKFCADCGLPDPVWASVNLLVSVCPRCIGFHRKLGVSISKPRSMLMDQKIWTPALQKLFLTVGNDKANSYWECKLPDDDKITPESNSDERWEFIQNKYQLKKFFKWSEHFGQPNALGKALRQSSVTDDIMSTFQLIFSGADLRYIPPDRPGDKLPYILAEEANKELQLELLKQNGADVEPVEPTPQPSEAVRQLSQDNGHKLQRSESLAESYEKTGYINKKGPSANSQYKRRYFMLKGTQLFYGKDKEPESGVVDLKKAISYVLGANEDTKCLDIITSDRTYSLKLDTEAECLEWYTLLRNKQVFGVPLECQDVGSDGIPHLIPKCTQYVESYGLEIEGIYRLSGNLSKIRQLNQAFNQDASGVLLSLEDFSVLDVTGTLKAYFRKLPDPLLTQELHGMFCASASIPNHDIKLTKMKDLLNKLPSVNYNCLKHIIGHLQKVTEKCDVNKMDLKNITIVFGPTLMSNDKMGLMDQKILNEECFVIGELIRYYNWMFDVGEEEIEKAKRMQEAADMINKLNESGPRQSTHNEFHEMSLDIYVGEKKDQLSIRIKVTAEMTAAQVRNMVIQQKGLPPEGNWELFEVVSEGDLERPYQSKEKVLAAMLKWKELGKGAFHIVKDNYLAQQIQTALLGKRGTVKIREAKKKDWKSLFLELKNGWLKIHKNEKNAEKHSSNMEKLSVQDLILYLGVDQRKPPHSKFGFSIVTPCSEQKSDSDTIRYVCVESPRELYNWVAAILNMKHPAGLWTDSAFDDVLLGDMDASLNQLQLGRQSVHIRPEGSSSHVVQQLKARHKSLKRSLRR